MLGTDKSRFSQRKCCKNPYFNEIVLYELRRRILSLLSDLGTRFSGLLETILKPELLLKNESRAGDLGTQILQDLGPGNS